MQMCTILRFKVPVRHRYLINRSLKVPILWKNRPCLVQFFNPKTICSLVQAFKNLTLCSIKSCKNRTLSVHPSMGVCFPGECPPRPYPL